MDLALDVLRRAAISRLVRQEITGGVGTMFPAAYADFGLAWLLCGLLSLRSLVRKILRQHCVDVNEDQEYWDLIFLLQIDTG